MSRSGCFRNSEVAFTTRNRILFAGCYGVEGRRQSNSFIHTVGISQSWGACRFPDCEWNRTYRIASGNSLKLLKFLYDILFQLPIEECLFGSLDSYDFQIKKTNFDVLKKTVEQCRVDGAKYAKGCAEKTLVRRHRFLNVEKLQMRRK